MLLTLAFITEAFVLYTIYINISKTRFIAIEAFIVTMAIFAMASIMFYIFPVAYVSMLAINIINIAILTVAARIKIQKILFSAFYAVLSTLIILLAGTLSSIPMSIIWTLIRGDYSREIVINDPMLYSSYMVLVFGVSFIISRSMGKFLSNRMSSFDEEIKKQLLMNILGAAVVVLMLFLINTFLQNIITDTSVLVMVYSVALSLCFAFLVFAIFAFSDGLQKEVEILRKKEELQNLQGYTQHIEEMVAGLRGFRHDHEYLMAGFYNYIREKDIANIEEYFNKYMRAFREDAASADSQLDRLKLIKVPPLKSILSYKLLQARGLGIQVYVDVLDPIENIEDDDLIGVCRMMGIILSNAIEGCQDEKQPMLGFMATVNGNNIFLVTENTCTTNMSLAEIFKSKFTTKESGRGVGLSNASQLIDANGNLKLETHLQDGTFLQSLSISTASPASP